MCIFFYIFQVGTEETQYIRSVENLIASRLSLKLQLQAIWRGAKKKQSQPGG